MFDIGLGEIILLMALALIVFGPDKLPKAAASAGRFVNQVKSMSAQARDEITNSADLGDLKKDLSTLRDLHPKRIIASTLDPTTAAEQKKTPETPAPPAKQPSAGEQRRPAAPDSDIT